MRIVSLAESATDFGGQAKVESHSKRLQRLFRSFEIGRDSLARLLPRLLPRLVPWRLAMDRTSRPFRKTDINFPMPGIAYRGIAVPIIRSMLLVSTRNSPRR